MSARIASRVALCAAVVACTAEPEIANLRDRPEEPLLVPGKADEAAGRSYEVLLNDPHCDVCTAADKAFLLENSAILQRVLSLIDGASARIDVAQFTFSRKEIEAALIAAHQRGVAVRVTMDSGQDKPGTVATRLKEAGLDVAFVAGKPPANENGHTGLQHAKYLIVDGHTVLTGSNNWSSTGVSFNDENSIVIRGGQDDPAVAAFQCHYEAMRRGELTGATACNTGTVRFSPGSGPRKLIRDEIRAAEHSIDVLMHHLTFKSLVKELRKAAERGVRVRLIVNAAGRQEHSSGAFQNLFAAGGQIRFKQNNEQAWQLMHHKLAIFDGRVLVNGSGNWSGSGFFNNWEAYVRYDRPSVVDPFVDLFDHLWGWSLTGQALDAGWTAAEQHAASHSAFFGNLHAHVAASDHSGQTLDDGKGFHVDDSGNQVPTPDSISDPYRHAWEYAREVGRMDFMAISPHTADDTGDHAMPNMTASGYSDLLATAQAINAEGGFVALPSFEWSTNSSGNHVNLFGSTAIAKIARGRFDLLFEEFLPERRAFGEQVFVQMNHPKTFPLDPTVLKGSWDQIFDISLTDIPKSGERKKKFNDFGLDDFEPLASVRQSWIDGSAPPSRADVAATLANIEAAGRDHLRLIEVLLARGTELSTESPVNPSFVAGDEVGSLVRRTRVHSDYDYYLRHGFRLAPTAPHDNHYENWGTGHTSRTGIVATGLTEWALLDAIERRSVFASEDQNLDVRLFAAGRVPMGRRHRTTTATVALQVLVSDPDFAGPFDVRVYQGRVGGDEVREVVHDTAVGGGQWTELKVSVDVPGLHFVYLEVLESGPDRMAWTSPVWIERLGSCGDGFCGSYEACDTCTSDCGACPDPCANGACDEPSCGDGLCDTTEGCATCAEDCGACESCGDGSCGDTEDCESCAADCGDCVVCGDGQCTGSETCGGCSEDCGACVVCGDGTCAEGSETCDSCQADCGPCHSCGDGQCTPGESCDSCAADCGACISCGDGTCNGNEACGDCPADCGVCAQCGDDECTGGETCQTCADDCGQCVVCGDGACSDSETCETCADDCGQCGGDCCETQSNAGCGNPTVQACVCAADSYCCDTQWDWLCRDQVTSLGCGACN